MEEKKLIEFRNIVKSFDGQVVLKGINLDIYENEFVTLLGPSGCGKTTLLRILGGFLNTDEGSVMFDGEEISQKPPYERELNTVFQKYALFPHLSVYENIVLPVELDGGEVDHIFLDEIIEMLSLKDKIDSMPNKLSGGQQQRVAIARALIAKPAIVLADEPTGNLDSKSSADVLGLLKRTGEKFNQTIVMITHNNEIAQLADRIIRIEDGRIVE